VSLSAGGKGDKRRPTKVKTSHVDAEYDRIFGGKKEAGRFKRDEETGKLIPIAEWNAKYYVPKVKMHYVVGDIDPYYSPINMQPIMSRKAHREDLLKNNSRVYEGREIEAQEAARFQSYSDEKLDKSLGECVAKTHEDLKNGNVDPAPSDKISWTFGED
jgi:hypothetical protein|tara:strand:- start:19266 stop:19742 length:477 start_codon:yes stop_codon:yes gene_type:complete